MGYAHFGVVQFMAYWQKERDRDFSQPLILFVGLYGNRTFNLLIKSLNPLINNRLSQHPTARVTSQVSLLLFPKNNKIHSYE